MSADKTEGKSDWSPAFARARTELVVTTVIILAVTHLDMNLSKIPGFGIDLAHGAPKATILAFLLLFFAYFLVVFVVKWLVERRDVQRETDLLRDLETRLNDHVNKLEMLPESEHGAAIDLQAERIHQSFAQYKAATFDLYDMHRAETPRL